MKWTRALNGRWMETCYICKGYVEEEIRSPLERCYGCTNSGCAARFQLFLSHPHALKKYGTFACLITADAAVLREGMNTFLCDELYASCPVCERVFADRGDGVLLCGSRSCGVSVEFYFEKLQMFFVALTIIMRIPEDGFSKILSRHLESHRYN